MVLSHFPSLDFLLQFPHFLLAVVGKAELLLVRPKDGRPGLDSGL